MKYMFTWNNYEDIYRNPRIDFRKWKKIRAAGRGRSLFPPPLPPPLPRV
jgi:hypothetical protein